MVCKDVVTILSSGQKLGWIKHIQLRMHLLLCKLCARYAWDLKMLDKGYKELLENKIKTNEEMINQFERNVLEKLFNYR